MSDKEIQTRGTECPLIRWAFTRKWDSVLNALPSFLPTYEVHVFNSDVKEYWTLQHTRYPAYTPIVNNQFNASVALLGIDYSTNDIIDL